MPPLQPNTNKVSDATSDEEDKQDKPRCDSLTVFQAGPLVWMDGQSGDLHPMKAPDFLKEKIQLQQVVNEVRNVGNEIDLLFEEATIDGLGAILTTGRSPVLHFSCHGHKEYLAIENMGALQPLGIDQLKGFVSAGSTRLKLVFVSACHSRPAGDAFIAAGVKHVICCKTEEILGDRAAIEFSKNFYRSLGSGFHLKAAFKFAHQAVLCSPLVAKSQVEANKFVLLPEKPEDDPYHDVPIFFTTPKSSKRVPQPSLVSKLSLPSPPKGFVGREVDTYKLVRMLSLDATNPQLIQVKGPLGIGKNSLSVAACHYVGDRQRAFSINTFEWVGSSVRFMDNDLSRKLDNLYEMMKDNSIGIADWRSSVGNIVKALDGECALIVIDARELKSERALKKLDDFTHDLSLDACLTSRICLGPLDPRSSVILFGNHCQFVKEGLVRGVESASDLADLLVPEDLLNIPPRINEVLSLIKHGNPTDIKEAAATVTKARYCEMILTGAIQLEDMISLGDSEINADKKELEVDVKRMKRLRDRIPSLQELSDQHADLVKNFTDQAIHHNNVPKRHSPSFADNQMGGAPDLKPAAIDPPSDTSSLGSVVGVLLLTDMDDRATWTEYIINSKRHIERLLEKLLRYGDLIDGATQITIETISSNGRERAAVILDCEIELHRGLNQNDVKRIVEICREIASILRRAGVRDEELSDIMIGAAYKGSLVLILEAPPAALSRLFTSFVKGGRSIPLSTSRNARVNAVSPAFIVTGPFALLQEEQEQLWWHEQKPSAVLWKKDDLSLIFPTSAGSLEKLVKGGVRNWHDCDDEAWKNLPLIYAMKAPSKCSRDSTMMFYKKYCLGRQIAAKKSSDVFEARERRSGKKVSVTLFSVQHLDKTTSLALQNEITCLKAVRNHPSIVAIEDCFDDLNRTIIVMGVCYGGTLMQRIAKKSMYTEEEAKPLCRSLLKGVEYIHSKYIAHRNFTPNSILLVSRDSDTDVKICGFGCAKKVWYPNSLKTICGTEGFIAPEVLRPHPAYDQHCDMWSLGVVIDTMLNGRHTENVGRQTQSNVSSEARNFISFLMIRNPKERATAREALQSIWLSLPPVDYGTLNLTEQQNIPGINDLIGYGNNGLSGVIEFFDENSVRSPDDVASLGTGGSCTASLESCSTNGHAFCTGGSRVGSDLSTFSESAEEMVYNPEKSVGNDFVDSSQRDDSTLSTDGEETASQMQQLSAVQSFKADEDTAKNERLEVADSHSNKGFELQERGDLDGALSEFIKAVEIQEQEVPRSLTLAKSYISIGYVLQDQGKLWEALQEYQNAQEIQERIEPDTLSLATTCNNIGSVLQKMGNLQGALREYRKGLAIQERDVPGSLEIATSYNNLGILLNEQGDAEGALAVYRKALEIQERISPASLQVATTYSNISSVLKDQNDLSGALLKGREALLIRKREAPISLALAMSYSNIGLILLDLGEWKEAWKYYNWSRDLLVNPKLSLHAAHPALARCNLELGKLCLKRKKYKQALQFADDILNVLPDYIWAYKVKGHALKGLGLYQDAINIFNEALERSPDYGGAYIGKLGAELELKKTQFHHIGDESTQNMPQCISDVLSTGTLRLQGPMAHDDCSHLGEWRLGQWHGRVTEFHAREETYEATHQLSNDRRSSMKRVELAALEYRNNSLAVASMQELYSKREDDTVDDDVSDGSSTVASSTFQEARQRLDHCTIVDAQGETGEYTGETLASTGMPHGVGRIVYDDGSVYEGDWRHGMRHGVGKMVFATEDSYGGEYMCDRRHGRGLYKWSDGRQYNGNFAYNEQHGKGTLVWPDGCSYQGNFEQGLRQGEGIYSFMDGRRYEIQCVNGCYTGVWEGCSEFHRGASLKVPPGQNIHPSRKTDEDDFFPVDEPSRLPPGSMSREIQAALRDIVSSHSARSGALDTIPKTNLSPTTSSSLEKAIDSNEELQSIVREAERALGRPLMDELKNALFNQSTASGLSQQYPGETSCSSDEFFCSSDEDSTLTLRTS